jgi:hypothetical protein
MVGDTTELSFLLSLALMFFWRIIMVKMDSKDLDFLLGSGVSVEYPQFVMTCEDVV